MENELQHYGVLGMKLGVRRSRKLDERANKHRRYAQEDREKVKKLDRESQSYRRAATKTNSAWKTKRLNRMADSAKKEADSYRESAYEWDKIAESNNVKAKSIRQKHEKLAGKETIARVETLSAGKLAAQTLLFGTYGALKYNEARSNGVKRGEAAVVGVLASAGNYATGGILSAVEPRKDQIRQYLNG